MSAAPILADLAGELALLLRATLLIGAAWAAATALRTAGASAAARHMAWLLGIAALLALPVLWWLVPDLRLPILPAEAAAAAAPSPIVRGPASTDGPNDSGWSLVLLTVYAVGAVTLLLRLVVGRRMLRRLWSDAGAVRDPAWETLLSRLSSGMGLTRRVELRISRGPAVPMTWGTLAPKVLLPADASEWPLERRRLVLLHELAHVARRDSFSRSLASLACALYWFHPGAWFAARRMRMEQELAADDRVLMAGGSAQAYALSLLQLARGAAARPELDQAAAMAGMYQLERRLLSITGPVRRKRPGTLFLCSSALLAGCATWLVAAGVPVSASPGLPGAYPPGSTGRVFAVDAGADLRQAVDSSPRPGPTERASRAPASESRPKGLASTAREIAETRPSRRDGTAANESEPPLRRESASPDPRQPAHAPPLRDYGWELPRRDSDLQAGFPAGASRQARLALPALQDSASSERTGRPRWARNVPRLVQGPPRVGSPPSASRGPLMLSWSLDVAGK